MRFSLNVGLAALTALVALPLAAQAQNIDTTSSWNGSSFVYPWGSGGNTPTYGQSITAPVGVSTLDTFGFRIAGLGGSFSGSYRAYVYAWNPGTNTLVGSALWDSGTLSLGSIAQDVFTPVNFAPSVAVTPGSSYMLFASTLGTAGTSGTGKWGLITADPYVGGTFAYTNDSSFIGTTWNTFPYDTAFTATFSASNSNLTPEMPGGVLLLAALLPIGAIAAKKRRQKA